MNQRRIFVCVVALVVIVAGVSMVTNADRPRLKASTDSVASRVAIPENLPAIDKLPQEVSLEKALTTLQFDDGSCESGLGTSGLTVTAWHEFDVPTQCASGGLQVVGVTGRMNTGTAFAAALGQAGPEEIAFIDSPDYDYDPRWRLGLTHTDLLSWAGASATMTVYNLDAQGLDGYGGRLSAYLPFSGHKLFAQPIAGFRILETEPQSTEFELTYLSLRVNGRLSPNWTLFAGFTHTYGDNADATLLDLGLRCRW